MSEWLDLMLDEIVRKRRESREAEKELERRKSAGRDKQSKPKSSQAK